MNRTQSVKCYIYINFCSKTCCIYISKNKQLIFYLYKNFSLILFLRICKILEIYLRDFDIFLLYYDMLLFYFKKKETQMFMKESG